MSTPSEETSTRREFLVIGAAGSALGLCSCSLFITTREPDVSLQAVDGEFRLDREVLASKGSVVVAVSGQPDKVLVFHRADGSMAAVSMTCTHLGCDVDYSPSRDLIVCPCHGSEFDTAGGNLKGPASRPLRAYAVRIEGGAVVVTLG